MMIVGVKSVIVCLPEEKKKMYARMNEYMKMCLCKLLRRKKLKYLI